MQVLVVDDHAAVRTRLAEMLAEVSGVDVRQASSGEEALQSVSTERPCVIVLDFHLPGMNGLAVLRALRALPAVRLVVVLTSDPSEGHRVQCLKHGADHFLDKAREFHRVVELVRDLAPDCG